MTNQPDHSSGSSGENPYTIGDIVRDPIGYGRTIHDRLNRRYKDVPVITSVLIAAAMLVFCGFLYFAYVGSTAPTAEGLDSEQVARASVVYAADGEEITRFYRDNRTWMPLDSIAPEIIDATLATEDRRFYDHFGVDVYRTFGAVWRTTQGDQQGGSTITMQLARHAFPDLQDDFILTRKIREWSTARHIERVYEKDEILEMYLNMMPFLYNTFGVEAASKTYFQRSAYEVDLNQAATLVAMLRGPSMYNPVRNPEQSKERRNRVLEYMVEDDKLDESRYAEYAEEETEIDFQRVNHTHNKAPFFAEHVRRQVGAWAEGRGYDIYTDGLRIHTTLDSRLQAQATEVADQHINELQQVVDVTWASANIPVESRNASDYAPFHDPDTAFNYYWQQNPETLRGFLQHTEAYEQAIAEGQSEAEALESVQQNQELVDSVQTRVQRLETGMIAMEPSTGYVRAWVGGRDFESDRYDRVSQSQRQPGSTFKPFVYAAALDNGLRPNDMVQDSEVSYEFAVTGDTWQPSNFDRVTGDTLSLRESLARSINTVAAQLTIEFGAESVAQKARDMGITSDLAEYPAIGLGTSSVTLLEMAVSYSTIANSGTRPDPVAVTRIENRDGELLESFQSRHQDVMSSHTAHDLLDMLRTVITDGTGVGLNQYVSGDLAGKTGTTQNNADTWFMMMHPDLVIGGWIGFNNPAVTFRDRQWGVGSRTALPLVGRFAQRAELSSDASFAEPAGWRPPSTSPGDTLMLVDVEESMDDAFDGAEMDDLELDDLLDDSDPLADGLESETEADQGPDLSDVEEQEPADSLNRAQGIDVVLGGSDDDNDASPDAGVDTTDTRSGW